jgi:hypothetical protein
MKAKVVLDKRDEFDKKYDILFEKMVRDASLNPRQKYIVSHYLKSIIGEKIREVENAMDMGFWLGLIELFQFGHNKRATRLLKLQKYVRDVLNEAYGVDCINVNGQIEYDGCGIYRLKNRLKNYGIEFVDEAGDK